jgi:photosystem II stability/assembly factor-like uncharacterized protein
LCAHFKKSTDMRKLAYSILLTFASLTLFSQSIPSVEQYFKPVKWRNIGPFRGGRSVASCGVVNNPLVYYMGSTGGGVWKTEDAGQTWQNISDGFFKTGSVGAITVSESDPNVIYVGMGEHPPRGVMTSYGDGVYKSTNGGKTWKKMGLDLTRHIAGISIHPQNPDIVYVAAQGALHGASDDRGVYKSMDGGKTWTRILFVDKNTGCVDLSMDMTNPRILYAAMWEHRRLPWQVQSGGASCGLYKSMDGGETWTRLEKGLPKELGKMGISVSRANPNKVYAVIESDTKTEKGGVFVSNDAGESWNRISKDHSTVQRAWYYIEIFSDPTNENTVYVLNTSILKSIDGGKTFTRLSGTHGDHHHLWFNPTNGKNFINSNDGGAAISFNGGYTWSSESNQPTAQFYRINADNRFPYRIYAGQQDNTSVVTASRNPTGFGISEKDWTSTAGGESAFLAFNPDNPRYVMGGSYQGTIEVLDTETDEGKSIMVVPNLYLSLQPKNMQYRFNWNAPIIYSMHEPNTYFHAGNRVFKTTNLGKTWDIISPDLTRHDTAKMITSGVPYTNEGAGGENYCTISYLTESKQDKNVMWAGSDDGLVHLTKDGGKTWQNVTPKGLDECLINCIEVSPHDKSTVYIATTRYKVNDFTPSVWKTSDYGKTWINITKNIPNGAYTRAIREDTERKGLLYCGTEIGLYISYNDGGDWQPFNLNLPITPITDLKVHQGDLLASTMGRAFWILDDLGAIRQYNSDNSKEIFTLMTPEDAYRVSGGSPLDKAEPEEDKSNRPSRAGFSGTNPASGVVLYYHLNKKDSSEMALTLEILDEKGQLIRQYSNKADKKVAGYPGGPSPEPLLSIRNGLNRFVWNMRYPTLPGVDRLFIEGNYEGRKVAPGNYQARLSSNGSSKTVSFKVLADPRLNFSATDYNEQQSVLTLIDDAVRDIHNAVNDMRKARKQINDVTELLENKPELKDVINSGKKVTEKISAWEEKLVQPKIESNDDVINFENKLSADFMFVKGEMDTNTPYVTGGQKQKVEELSQNWQTIRGQMNELIQKDISDFNKLCNQKQLGKITMPNVTKPTD